MYRIANTYQTNYSLIYSCFLKMADSCRTMNEFTKAIMFANKGLQVTVKWKLPLDMLDLLFEMGLSYMLRGY